MLDSRRGLHISFRWTHQNQVYFNKKAETSATNLGLFLEVSKHGVSIGDLEWIRARVLEKGLLDEHLLNGSVIDDHGVAPRTFAESTLRVPDARHTHSTSELASTIGKNLDCLEAQASNGLVLGKSLLQSPLTHDEGIVDGKAVNLVNSKAFDFFVLAVVSRKVSGRASGGECSGEGENNNALALEEVIRSEILPIEWVLVGALNAAAKLPQSVGNLISLLLGGSVGSGKVELERFSHLLGFCLL